MQLSLFRSSTPNAIPENETGKKQKDHILTKYLPPSAVEEILSLLAQIPVRLTIVKERISKSGDYRAPHGNNPARITVNGNLNPYSFLLTLVHEMAHHCVWIEHARYKKKLFPIRKRTPLPHGIEWKHHFRKLMIPFLSEEVFPPSVVPHLARYLENPKASSSADHALTNALRTYDAPCETTPLESLPFDAVFSLHGKRMFRKKEKVRTRYRCICLKSNRIYLVSANAPVILQDE